MKRKRVLLYNLDGCMNIKKTYLSLQLNELSGQPRGINMSKNFVMNYIYREIMKICNETSLYIFENILICNITDPNFAVN